MTSLFPLNELSDKLLFFIFKFLPIRDRIRLRRVSTRWSKLILLGIMELRFNFDDPYCSDSCSNAEWSQIDSSLTIELPALPGVREKRLKRDSEKETKMIISLIKLTGKRLRKLVVEDFACIVPNERIWTTLVGHCPNITCLRISFYPIKNGQVVSLLQAYGNRLEELKLLNYYFRDPGPEWATLLVKYGNPDRLRKLGIAVDSTESLKMLCNTFPNLTLLYLYQEKGKDVFDLFPLAELKRLQFLVLVNRQIFGLKWFPVQDWSHSMVGLHFQDSDLLNFQPNLSFLKEMTSLRRLSINTKSLEDLNFVCRNLPLEIEFLEVKLTSFESETKPKPKLLDFSRLQKLQTLVLVNNCCPRTTKSFEFLDQTPLLSVRHLKLVYFGNQDDPHMIKLISKMNSIFPNFKNVHFNLIKGSADFW